MSDCMKMMDQAGPEKATKDGKHKGCTPADCLNYMIACAGIAAALPADAVAVRVAYSRDATQRPALSSTLHGLAFPPDIKPPIA